MIGRAVYHVPRSQVWEGSRGRQRGNTHLHVTADLKAGRFTRLAGRALCSKQTGWYEREPQGEHETAAEGRCPDCVERAARYGVEWPNGDVPSNEG